MGSLLLEIAASEPGSAGYCPGGGSTPLLHGDDPGGALHRRDRVVRQEVEALTEGPAIPRHRPLTSDASPRPIQGAVGDRLLAFFDAIAPSSMWIRWNQEVVFRGAGRFEEDGDYLKLPPSRRRSTASFIAPSRRGTLPGARLGECPLLRGMLPSRSWPSGGTTSFRFGRHEAHRLVDPRDGVVPMP